MSWNADNWKQGALVHITEQIDSLPQDLRGKFLIISHDCDLSRPPDKDATIEMIPCSQILPNSDIKGKNPRLLRITTEKDDFCLCADQKIILNKEDIPPSICPQTILSKKQCRILQTWLAARYKRQALPNALDKLLSKIFKKFFEKWVYQDELNGNEAILGVWLYYDPDEEISPGTGDGYECTFYFVYDTEEPASRQRTEDIINNCKKKIDGELLDTDPSVIINLIAVPDSEFSYNSQRKLTQWYYDFISNSK